MTLGVPGVFCYLWQSNKCGTEAVAAALYSEQKTPKEMGVSWEHEHCSNVCGVPTGHNCHCLIIYTSQVIDGGCNLCRSNMQAAQEILSRGILPF